jgi:hypothetical protein
MASGYVVFKGKDTEIEMVEHLIAQIKDIYKEVCNGYPVGSMRAKRLIEYLGESPEKNELLKTFVSNIEQFFGSGLDYFADYQLIFDNSKKSLDIGGKLGHLFPTDEWADLLGKTFPGLSFFFIGEMFNDIACGMEWYIYKEGKCVDSENYVYNIEYLDEEKESLQGEWMDCVEKLVDAEISIWELTDGDGQLLRDAEEAKKAAKRELEIISKKLQEAQYA